MPSMPSEISTQTESSEPLNLQQKTAEVKKFRESEEGKQLLGKVLSEYTRAKNARSRTQRQWYENMSMFFGNQNVQFKNATQGLQAASQLIVPSQPKYRTPQPINITRGIVRTEMAKLLSTKPTTTVVPATAEDEDFRMALAAEQTFEAYSNKRQLRDHMSKAVWWASVTGNGFIKVWWDNSCIDPHSGDIGDIRYGAVTPFHVFVPDLLETDLEDQPFIIVASTKSPEWVQRVYGELAGGVSPTVAGSNDIMETAYLNLDSAQAKPDSVMVYEVWVKPGGFKAMPQGGYLTIVDKQIVQFFAEGLPYEHNQYPLAKIDSIPTAKFYADSTLNDTNNLQREYNEIRQSIRDAGRRMARPQLLVERGSLVVNKLTNEPGSVIEYKPGRPAPQPIPLAQLPQYYVDQQDRIKGDLEDVSGQHQVSKGQAPAGLTAGTAITALQERDDQYLTTTFDSLERAYEKVAYQTITNFVQFVDIERQVKIVGADGAFDTLELRGADLSGSTDIRVESGSTVGQSRAAKQAYLLDMWQYGIITDPQQILKLLDVGGAQSILDTMNVAERAAQRENIKMKKSDPYSLEETQQQWDDQMSQVDQMQQQATQMGVPLDPNAAPGLIDPQTGAMLPEQSQMPVNEWDDHATHIRVHNTFRMTQEFELLPDPIKREFENHVALHQAAMQKSVLTSFLNQIPGDGTDGGSGQPQGSGATGQPGQMPSTQEATQQQPDGSITPAPQGAGGMPTPPGTLAGNGAAPAPGQPTQGA